MARRPQTSKYTKDEIRLAAEADLQTFAALVNPSRVYGDIHMELYQWWQREDAKDHQLCLMPRDHQKSHQMATRVAWHVTKNPATTVAYVSSTSDLAEKQLYFIKNIFTSAIYRMYWPEMVNKLKSQRELWNVSEIAVDHPLRKKEGVRDPTIKTGGLTTNWTGFHCNVAALDDVVVYENAYNKEGRDKVATMYSLLSSVETTDAEEWVVGTRYHPDDLYSEMVSMTEPIYTEDGNWTDERNVYEVFERVVETGGEFLWPRQQRRDGRWFGFDWKQLMRKKAKYLNRAQFYAQYYNDPNDPENFNVDPAKFQYYNQEHLSYKSGKWMIGQKVLNVFAAMDFAFTIGKRSDYSAIVVIGVDADWNIYVLEVCRFKTNRISVMFDQAMRQQTKWHFRKLRVETTAGQEPIVNEFRQYMRQSGIFFALDEHKPSRHEGTKQERINNIVQPRYDAQTVWHYRGGNCSVLEDELMLANPQHEDCKDSLASAIETACPPSSHGWSRKSNIIFHPRFGGVA